MSFLIFLASAAVSSSDIADVQIVVTASRTPSEESETAASVSVITDRQILRTGEPLAYSLLRLTPSVSVASSGPSGTFTQVRIRGAEANHTLLFVDGIKANDLSFGDEPRFELLNADLLSKIEVVRGPQSALWGSEAIGGVIAVNGATGGSSGAGLNLEAGSLGFGRAAARVGIATDRSFITGAIGWQRARGIDISGGGDRDGYRNSSGRALAKWSVSPKLTLEGNGFVLSGVSQYDGRDPFTFARTQDLSTRFSLAGARAAIKIGQSDDRLSGFVSATDFEARNHTLLNERETSAASARRATFSGQLQYLFATHAIQHELVVAAEHERETFKARDIAFGGLSNQDSKRTHSALVGEWKAVAGPVSVDLAARHEKFSRFKDSTSLRASLLAHLGRGVVVASSYGEGIAQPNFTELYGFFPGNFIGNPKLRPEKSQGFEASLRLGDGPARASLTFHKQRLHDEIATIFPAPSFVATTINRTRVSRRHGVEAEAEWTFKGALKLGLNYAYLNAREPSSSGDYIPELRRPKHSGSALVDGQLGRFEYGASIAYVGARIDTDFDTFPSRNLRLAPYWLVGARLAFRVRNNLELFVRGANLFDQHYQDVLSYRTEGRAVYAGVRLG